MKLTREYLSKLLPAFNKKSSSRPAKKPVASVPASSGPVTKQPITTVQPKPPDPPPDPVEMLDSVIKFLRRYLVCEDYQYTILALWIVHTWCFHSFPTAPYLQIRAAESHSAKTLCLRLLAALSNAPWFATGA